MHAHSALKLLFALNLYGFFTYLLGFSEHLHDSEKKLEKMINI